MISRPTNGLWVEHFILCKLKGLVWLHYFHPEAVLYVLFIFFTAVFRDLEWIFFRILKIVPAFHHSVAFSYYDSCHPPHFRPNEVLKFRENFIKVAPVTLGTVKNPDCINIPSGRLVHQLKLDSWDQILVWNAFDVVEALDFENPNFSILQGDLIVHVLLRLRFTGISHKCQRLSSQVIDQAALSWTWGTKQQNI